MKQTKINLLFLVTVIISLLWSCNTNKQWKGQEPIKKVSTLTRPIQQQLKKTWELGNGIYASNQFTGARLNGMVLTGDTLLTALITPENTPINASPWYAFKIWAEKPYDIYLNLTYLEGVQHRYYPKLSHDGKIWSKLDSANYIPPLQQNEKKKKAAGFKMKLSIGPDTLWISAQELITSNETNTWATQLAEKSYVTKSEIAKSRDGRAINLLKIGNADDKKMILVLSRQHPPEVTGYLAMEAFVETLCLETETAKRFRETYNTYVIPCINPDGVDNGHWRHNSGGIDLNRDWSDFNQPEVSAVKNFMTNKVANSGGKFYFAVDFHSTSHDIYYTINPKLKGNMPGLVPKIINAVGDKIQGYEPNIRPNGLGGPRISSKSFLFYEFGAEAVTFEIGDNTPRKRITLKGKLTALKLMEQMIKSVDTKETPMIK